MPCKSIISLSTCLALLLAGRGFPADPPPRLQWTQNHAENFASALQSSDLQTRIDADRALRSLSRFEREDDIRFMISVADLLMEQGNHEALAAFVEIVSTIDRSEHLTAEKRNLYHRRIIDVLGDCMSSQALYTSSHNSRNLEWTREEFSEALRAIEGIDKRCNLIANHGHLLETSLKQRVIGAAPPDCHDILMEYYLDDPRMTYEDAVIALPDSWLENSEVFRETWEVYAGLGESELTWRRELMFKLLAALSKGHGTEAQQSMPEIQEDIIAAAFEYVDDESNDSRRRHILMGSLMRIGAMDTNRAHQIYALVERHARLLLRHPNGFSSERDYIRLVQSVREADQRLGRTTEIIRPDFDGGR